MSATTVDRLIRCKHCPSTTASSPDAARMLGWRMFKGVSQTGKPLDDVVCPGCAGTTPITEDKPASPSWRVRCNTCYWEWEDEFDEGPLSPKDAKSMAHDHECEPEVEIAPPSGEKWFHPYDVSDEGVVVQ
jgi:hypothetical protein